MVGSPRGHLLWAGGVECLLARWLQCLPMYCPIEFRFDFVVRAFEHAVVANQAYACLHLLYGVLDVNLQQLAVTPLTDHPHLLLSGIPDSDVTHFPHGIMEVLNIIVRYT